MADITLDDQILLGMAVITGIAGLIGVHLCLSNIMNLR